MVKFNCKFTFNNTNKMLSDRNLEAYGKGQKFVDKEAIRIMTPYTPKDSSALITSATRLTKIGSGLIRQGRAGLIKPILYCHHAPRLTIHTIPFAILGLVTVRW